MVAFATKIPQISSPAMCMTILYFIALRHFALSEVYKSMNNFEHTLIEYSDSSSNDFMKIHFPS